MTPREIDGITTAYLRWQDIENRRIGSVGAMAWNAQRYDSKKKKSWVEWHQVVPPFFDQKRKQGLSHAEALAQARQQIAQVYRK